MIPSPFLAELGNEIRILGQKPDSFSASRTEKSPLEKNTAWGLVFFMMIMDTDRL